MHVVRPAACLFLLTLAALAQSDRSSMTGTVTDPAGAVVPDAPVQAKNLDTGVVYPTVSTSTGNYTIPELPVGNYELSSTVTGFKRYVRQGLAVQAAQTYRLDIRLDVGAATDSVTVMESAPLLKTESGELAHNITGENLDSLPVLGIGSSFASNSGIRNPLAVTQLIPGGIYVGDNIVRLNGAPSNTQSVRIEGQDSTNYTWVNAASQSQPSVDSIQEFAVQTSNYAAEFGKAGGGVYIVTMKSGTNNYHGSGYDYFVNEALNANTAFINTKPVARRNDYGLTFGGPVWVPKVYKGQNRSFFFYNFEQFRESAVINNVPLTVPTAAYRIGDFSTALTTRAPFVVNGKTYREGQIFDPATQSPTGRTAFLNNQIPAVRFDPVAVAIQKLIPSPLGPNANALFNNFLPVFSAIRHTDINSMKWDQTMTSHQKFSVFWSRTHTFSPTSTVLGADGLPDPITQARGNYDWVYTTRINYDYTLTPTMLLHVGAGLVDQHGPTDYTLPRDAFEPSSIGLKGVATTGRFPQMTGLLGVSNTGGMATMGPPTVGGTPENPGGGGIHSWRPGGNVSLTWIRGNHTYKAGAEALIGNYMYGQQATAAGRFAFSANSTSDSLLFGQTIPGGAVVGFPYASFLLGATDSGTIGAPTDQHLGEKSFALFAQDSWKVTRKFTLDYGLRWDFQTYLREGAGRMPSFSPTTLNPTVGLPGATLFDGFLPGRCQCNFASNYPYAIGPRLGAAYQITPKTVLRAGFGIVYAKTAAYDNLTITGSDSFFQSPGQYIPSMYLTNGVPVVPKSWPNLDPGQFPNILSQIGTAPSAIDRNAGRPARQLQWSIGAQREISRDLVVELGYVGNRGAWWQASNVVAYNALSLNTLQGNKIDITNPTDQKLLTSNILSAAVVQRGFRVPYAAFPTTQNLDQALRPFPQFGNIAGMYAPLGDTWYNSLQLKVTKRLSHGLDFSYSFLWSKSETIGAENESAVITGIAGGAAPSGIVNDVFNRAINKYISGYDQPLSSNLAVNYKVQSFSGNKYLTWVARDWTIGAFLQYRSGLPIRVPSANSNLNSYFFQGASFANRNAGVPLFLADINCHCFDPAKTLVLNPAAWSDPPAGQFGTSAAYYGDYRYQRRPIENLSLGRTFRIKERASLNIRAEFTNIFNRLEMANPSSTNAATPPAKNGLGQYTAGFGFINTTSGTASLPRQGTLIARFTF